jgi:hypothetical protein
MIFLVNMFNHNEVGQRSLEDVVGIFGHQLRSFGHQIVWETSNTRFLGPGQGINIIVEGFFPYHVPIIAEAHSKGARFLMLATEEPTDKGFNHGTQEEMVVRQRVFPEVAKYFDGILHLVPGENITRWYGQFAPTAQIELGYAPTLVRNHGIVPDYDFGFYGSLTPRRLKLLKRLANKINSPKAVKIVSDFKTQTERDQLMSRAKVIVQIRKFEEMGLVSSSRCNTALHIGRPVVAEPHLLSKPWDEVVDFAASIDDFFSKAIMAKAMWKGLHGSQMEKFKKKLSPEFCVGHALAAIGMTDDSAQRKVA